LLRALDFGTELYLAPRIPGEFPAILPGRPGFLVLPTMVSEVVILLYILVHCILKKYIKYLKRKGNEKGRKKEREEEGRKYIPPENERDGSFSGVVGDGGWQGEVNLPKTSRRARFRRLWVGGEGRKASTTKNTPKRRVVDVRGRGGH